MKRAKGRDKRTKEMNKKPFNERETLSALNLCFLNWEYPYLHQYHELPTEDGIHMTIPGEQR
jgi:hypothetical protein